MSTTFQPRPETAETHEPAPRPVEGTPFAELYERYFPELYDFVVRTMGETERASDVVTTAFVQTLMGFRQQRTTAPVDAILFATARDIALDKLSTKSGTADPAIQAFLQERFTAIDAGRAAGAAGAPDQDLADLVWQLLAAHAADEYSLIDLVVRRGIPVESLAPATRYSVEELRAAVAGIQANVEDWITTALLIHRGSKECATLNAALDQVGPNAPSADLRAAVQQHVSGCATCPEFRRRYPTASETFAALAVVPAPEGLREAVWLDVSPAIEKKAKASAASRKAKKTDRRNMLDALDAPVRLWNAATAKQKIIAGSVVALGVALFIGASIMLAPGGGIGIEDPQGFTSTTHELGTATASDVVALTWEAQPEATAYSVEWSQEEKTLPDNVADLDGAATGTKSPVLAPGEWYFHLRTQGPEGQWTSTVHLGPFVILAPDDEDQDGGSGSETSPTPTPSASKTPTPTPVPAPEPTAAPEPGPDDGGYVPEPEPEPEPEDPGPEPTTPPVVEGACPDTIPLPEAAAPYDAMGPVQTVREYYLLINEGRYAEAYGLLSADLQALYAPFSTWADGYATTTIVSPLTAVLVEQGVDYAVVYVEVVAVDVDPSEGEVEYLYQGTWVLTTDGGPWVLAGADVAVTYC
jgi:DNA-directed RNA polymerase specialized sigma24 family protein